MERLSSDNWVWNYTVIYINRDARGWEGGWLIIYYFLAVVPIIECSDMFCCEQLSPNESKQICDLKPYLEVRLHLGDMGLISSEPRGLCVFLLSGSRWLCIWIWLSLCILSCKMCIHGEMLWFARKTTTLSQISVLYQRRVWEGLWFFSSLSLVCFISVRRGTKLLCRHENE